MVKKNSLGLAAAALVAGVLVTSSALGDESYNAPALELWEGQQDYDLTEGIVYDKSRYTISVADMGSFDVNMLGIYMVGYHLTPIAQAEAGVPDMLADISVLPARAFAWRLVPRAAAEEVPAEPESTVEPQAPIEPEPSAELPVSTEPEAPAEPQVPAELTPVEPESPAEELTPITFVCEVVVKSVVTYEDRRLDLSETDLLAGVSVLVDAYNVNVLDDGGFDTAAINEYQVTYALHDTAGQELRQFSCYLQVARPGVNFYAPNLVAEGEMTGRGALRSTATAIR